MEWQTVSDLNRDAVNAFIKARWHGTSMVLRGKEVDMTQTEGFCVREGGKILGLLTYLVRGDEMEITSLDSLRENQGTGSKLVEWAVQEAKARQLKRIVLITTNDNINAIRFYQKRGFDMACLYRNAMEVCRDLKPEIPLIGENGIPLRHEIEFEMML